MEALCLGLGFATQAIVSRGKVAHRVSGERDAPSSMLSGPSGPRYAAALRDPALGWPSAGVSAGLGHDTHERLGTSKHAAVRVCGMTMCCRRPLL